VRDRELSARVRRARVPARSTAARGALRGERAPCGGARRLQRHSAAGCQWHERENVVSHLAKAELQVAYAHATYTNAKRALERLYRELRLVNESAAASLLEGLEETLTLHRLTVFPELGMSFKTTNLIESVMARLAAKTRRVTRRVTRRRTSDQKLRWSASALWAIERQFRRVKTHRHLPLLKQALQPKLSHTKFAAA
jgi:putative transposase